MIKYKPSPKNNEFYNNKHVNRLVDISLEHLGSPVFNDVLLLITSQNLDKIKKYFSLFKSKPYYDHDELYCELQWLFDLIYNDVNCDNLRGVFLELLVFRSLYKKYGIYSNNSMSLECFVEIGDFKSSRTVDIFALCNYKGLVAECKLGSKYFEKHDIENLNKIFNYSNKILSLFIISLAPLRFIQDKLYNIVQEDDTNLWVHLDAINIISSENIGSFLS